MTEKKKEDLKTVYQCISEVTKKVASVGISKDKKNKMQGYNFRGIDDVYNTLSTVLSDVGLNILPNVINREQVERKTKNGGALFYTTVTIEYALVSKHDGSEHKCIVYGEAMDSADKSTNKAMSAAYKYLCLQAFCIPTEGDNDADSITHEVESKPIKQEPKMMDGKEFLKLQENIRNAKNDDELAKARLAAKENRHRMLEAQQLNVSTAIKQAEERLDEIPEFKNPLDA